MVPKIIKLDFVAFCIADWLTGFYMRATLAFNGLTRKQKKRNFVIFHGNNSPFS